GRPLGGAGAGNRALTIYMANQLSKRIKAEKIDQIEMQFLHPADTESLIYKYNNKPKQTDYRHDARLRVPDSGVSASPSVRLKLTLSGRMPYKKTAWREEA